MSGSNFANKISRMNSKIAKKLGFEFNVYRSVDYLTPISGENYLNTIYLSYSLDSSFTKPQTYDFSLWNLYPDFETKVGDVFVGIEIKKTFVVVGKELFSPIQGLSTNTTISIYRPTYNTTSGSLAPHREEIYIDVPAVIIGTQSSQDPGPAVVFPTKQAPKSAVLEWDVWCWLPFDSLKSNDIIVDSRGIEGIIKSIQSTELGYKLHITAAK